MGSELAQWVAFDEETAQEEEKALQTGGSEFMRLEVGRNIVRILPPLRDWGRRSPFVVAWRHYVDIPGAPGPLTFDCPRMHNKGPCPVCAKADALKASGDKDARDKAFRLFARRRVYTNVLDRSDEAAGPKVLAFGKLVHEQLLKLRNDPDAGGDYTHPIKGFDVVIERQGTGKFDTNYFVRPSRPRPLHEDAGRMREILEAQQDPALLIQPLTADEILDKLREAAGGGGGARPARPERTLPAERAPARSRNVSADVESAYVDADGYTVHADDDEDDLPF